MSDNVTALSWYAKLGFNFVEEAPLTMGKTTVMHRIGYRIIPSEAALHLDGDENNEQ